ncbi:hypothetical protein V8C40DRAFT_265078 [Trichoderma camerunense]
MSSNENQQAQDEQPSHGSISQEQTQETQQNGQAGDQSRPTVRFHRGVGTGNVFHFRIGPDIYWIRGSGPGGSLTANEEARFYRAMEMAGVRRDEDIYIYT